MPLDAQKIAEDLVDVRLPSGLHFVVRSFDEVDSTNAIIKDAAAGQAPEGLVATALRQTKGYGRQGRTWESLPGGLYLSLLVRPAPHGRPLGDLPTLGHAVALAIRSFLVGEGVAIPVFVKWPNDIVCDAGKLAGISSEMVGDALCIGMGINLFVNSAAQSLDGKYVAAYARGFIKDNGIPDHVPTEGLSFDQIRYMESCVVRLLQGIARAYGRWIDAGFASLRAEYEACSYLMGKQVRMASLDGSTKDCGVACGIDDSGRLLVRTSSGELLIVGSEEVHLL